MKTKKNIIFLFVSLFITRIQAQEVFQHEKLTKLWETKEGLKTPESVLLDPVNKVIYVSNVNDKPWEKDGNGFISKLSLNGDFIAVEWVKGLNAPKGMGISIGKLYVTDVDEVVEIDLKLGKIVKKYTNEKAQNLNDITVGDDGTVYVSNSKGTNIFKVGADKLDVVFESEAGNKTNGIFYEKGKLLLGYSNKLVSLDLNTKKLSTLVDSTGYIDGLEAIGNGGYLISDWAGHVNIIQPGKFNLLILDTTPKKINAADIEFDLISKILYIPTFFDNHVVAYKLK